MKKISIIGCGMVGGALLRYLEKTPCKLFAYDKYKEIGSIKEVNKADYVFVCVPTPTDRHGNCDLRALNEVVAGLTGKKVVIIKSTILPGTTAKLQAQYPQHKFLFNPEFLTEVTADQDMNYPDRQIIGYTDKSYSIAEDVMLMLPLAPYEKIVPSFVAEFSKYANNIWFALKVAHNNQLYDVFEKFGGEKEEFETLIDCMSADKRIGRSHLQVWHKGGRGYSGKCLPKDSKAFIKFSKKLKKPISILETADKYNEQLLKEYGNGK